VSDVVSVRRRSLEISGVLSHLTVSCLSSVSISSWIGTSGLCVLPFAQSAYVNARVGRLGMRCCSATWLICFHTVIIRCQWLTCTASTLSVGVV
jgi:hypothetical protein